MLIKKLYKSNTLNCDGGINVEYGAASEETSKIICVCGKSYLSTNNIRYDILDVISHIMLNFKKKLIQILHSHHFSTNIIFDYDFPKNIHNGVRNKILNFEVYIPSKDYEMNNNISVILKEAILYLNESFINNKIGVSKVKIT